MGPAGGLEEMTSADDFHLVSWKNALGLTAVMVAALVPVVLRKVFQREVEEGTEAVGNIALSPSTESINLRA